MKKRTPAYYLAVFGMLFAFMFILGIVSHAKGTYLVYNSLTTSGIWSTEFSIFLYSGKTFILGPYLLDWAAIIVMPASLVLIFWLIDFSTGKLKGKKQKESEIYESFVDSIGAELNGTHLFNVEDYRHFRENAKFQECIKTLYYIYDKGADDNHNYPLILRKFEKGTKERDAVEYLITFTEKKILVKPPKKEEPEKKPKKKVKKGKDEL